MLIYFAAVSNAVSASVILFGLLLAWLLVGHRQTRVSLRGKYICISGCDSGFGFGIVQKLCKEGANVIAICYTSDGVERVLKCGAHSALRVDLSIETEIDAAAAEIISRCDGDLWAIIHNAGCVAAGMIDFTAISNYRRVMEVNFFAVVSLNKYLLPILKRPAHDNSAKRIILVSSVDGLVSLPGNAPYDASKFALEAYADALRVEQSFWNICVTVINPSTMKTPIALGFFDTERNTYNQALKIDSDPHARWKKEWSPDWLEQHIKVNKSGLEQIAQDPIIVITDIMEALTARSPKFRYLSGIFAKTLFYFLWISPEIWSFRIKKALINPPPFVSNRDDKIKHG